LPAARILYPPLTQVQVGALATAWHPRSRAAEMGTIAFPAQFQFSLPDILRR
jgi:hypothetical protein